MDYYELVERAAAKNILTFGDIIKAMYGQVTLGDAYDVFGTEEAEDMLSEALYWCDAATGALEMLAEESLI